MQRGRREEARRMSPRRPAWGSGATAGWGVFKTEEFHGRRCALTICWTLYIFTLSYPSPFGLIHPATSIHQIQPSLACLSSSCPRQRYPVYVYHTTTKDPWAIWFCGLWISAWRAPFNRRQTLEWIHTYGCKRCLDMCAPIYLIDIAPGVAVSPSRTQR